MAAVPAAPLAAGPQHGPDAGGTARDGRRRGALRGPVPVRAPGGRHRVRHQPDRRPCWARPAPRSSRPTRPAGRGPQPRRTGTPGPASGRPTSTTPATRRWPPSGMPAASTTSRRMRSTGSWGGCWTGWRRAWSTPEPRHQARPRGHDELAARMPFRDCRGRAACFARFHLPDSDSRRRGQGTPCTESPECPRSPASCRWPAACPAPAGAQPHDLRVLLQLGLGPRLVAQLDRDEGLVRMLTPHTRSGSRPPGRQSGSPSPPSTPVPPGTGRRGRTARNHEPVGRRWRRGLRRRGELDVPDEDAEAGVAGPDGVAALDGPSYGGGVARPTVGETR